MAKISAHNARKLAELKVPYHRGSPDEFFGEITEYFYVLTSDRRILRSYRYPEAKSAYDRKRSSYKIVARIKPTAEDPMRIFRTYVERQARYFNSEVMA